LVVVVTATQPAAVEEGAVELVEIWYPVTPTASVPERLKAAAVTLVVAALPLIVRLPVGGVVSVAGGV
jgi:hypothetical protein